MTPYLVLLRTFILRALRQEKLRTVVTIAGVSLGVAVMVAIRLANATSLHTFRTATESLAGKTAVQIVGTAGRFDETLLSDLLWLREYGQMSPVIRGDVLFAGKKDGLSRPPKEFLTVMGVDILRDLDIRRYQLVRLREEGQQPNGREFLDLLRDQQAAILTEKFAARHNIDVGERITVIFNDRPVELTVRGLLLDSGPARAMDGNFVLMDIAVAQVLFQRLGIIDRVDVVLDSGLDVEMTSRAIAERLPNQLTTRPPAKRYRQVETMIAAFHFNLNALGLLALLVGLFLVYNSVAVAVIRRRREIGILRALGAGRALVQLLFLGEAALLAIVGTLLGLPLGKLMAQGAVDATATTVETFYIARSAIEHATAQPLGVTEVFLAFGVALPLSLVAALLPARESTRVSPVEITRGATGPATIRKPSGKLVCLAVGLLLASWFLSLFPAWNSLPIWGYAAAVCVLFGGAFLVPGVLWGLCSLVQSLLVRQRWTTLIEGELACANLRGAVSRVAISVASLAVSLAMMVAISIMIGSFRDTVTYWVGQTLRADLFVKPAILTSATGEAFLSPEVIDSISADSEVVAVDRFTARSIDYEGHLITLGAGDFGVVLDHGSLSFKAPPEARNEMKEAISRQMVIVSESFSLRFDKNPGDVVRLPATTGQVPFTVAAVYYDYSNNRGTVVMDRGTYSRFFIANDNRDLSRNLAVYLVPTADPNAVQRRLRNTIGAQHEVVISTQDNIRREVLRIFDSTFVITYALEVIAILIAALGVISTLLTLLLDRRKDIALLGVLGTTARQTRRVILYEALLIGATSLLIGCGVGTLLSLILIYVINVQSFGWTIQYHYPWLFVLQTVIAILVTTGVASLYPAARAARWSGVGDLREE